jgi:hypothetical protein
MCSTAGFVLQSSIQVFPNLGQIQPSRAKIIKGKSFDFLRRIEPFQGVAATPRAIFSSWPPITQ